MAYEGADSQPGHKALAEIMNTYIVLRNNVLTPILKDATAIVLKPSSSSSSSHLNRSGSSNEKLNEKSSKHDSNGNNGNDNNNNDNNNNNGDNDKVSTTPVTTTDETTKSNGGGVVTNTNDYNLCAGIRQAYSILLRVSQLENHLFDSLFKTTTTSTTTTTTGGGNDGNDNQVQTNNVGGHKDIMMFSGAEILTIVENICGTTGDAMR